MYDPPGYLSVGDRRNHRDPGSHGPPRWFSAFGITDLVVALTLGAATDRSLLATSR